jgi:hypothetical protein
MVNVGGSFAQSLKKVLRLLKDYSIQLLIFISATIFFSVLYEEKFFH